MRSTFLLDNRHLPFHRLITQLTTTKAPVHIITGAGASIDAGLPTWDRLAEKLVEHALTRRVSPVAGESAAIESAVRDHVRRECGTDAAKTIQWAQLLLGPKFWEAFRTSLYEDITGVGREGPLTFELSRLIAILGGRATVATLNYDTILEDALKGVRRAPEVEHYHGKIPQMGVASPLRKLMVTQSDFLLRGGPVIRKMAEHMSGRITILVGMSLSDTNIISARLKLGQERGGFADSPCFAIVMDEAALDRRGDSSHHIVAELKADQHKEQLGIEIVPIKAYSQAPQVLHELALAAAFPRHYAKDDIGWQYLQRLSEWRTRFEEDNLAEPDDWREFSSHCHEVLTSCADEVAHTLGIDPDDSSQERLAVHLWLRRSDRFALQLFGASNCVHDRPWSQMRETIPSRNSEDVSARVAFIGTPTCFARPEVRAEDQGWRILFAVPLILRHSYWSRLPVGAVTVSSTGLPTWPDDGGSKLWKAWNLEKVDEVVSLCEGAGYAALAESPA